MTPDRWAKVKEILADALELEPEARRRFVGDASGDDPELLEEILRLLKESERDTGLLSRPAVAFQARPRCSEGDLLTHRFNVVRFIARGGMGEVYEADDLDLGERVALKIMRPTVAADELLSLLKREVQLARRVTHRNVCRIYDLFQHIDAQDGVSTTLLSMELLHGSTLAEHLATRGPLPWGDALPLIRQIDAGIQAAHDAGVIHGDLKPANVMLVPTPDPEHFRAVVMDFGVALPAAQGELTLQSRGTPGYLAPEQIEGKPITTATDIYAFGLVIQEMLGRDTLHKTCPPKCARIIESCFQHDPERRPARASDLVDLFEAAGKPRWRYHIRIAAVVAMAVVLAALARHQWTAANPIQRQLFTEDAGEYVWSVSPDGRSIAETRWDTGDLAIRDTGNGRIRRITHGSCGNTWGAVFSADSRRLVYRCYKSRTDAELRVIGADGKGERLLYKDPNGRYIVPVDWSKDGKRVLVQVDRGIGIVSVDDGRLSPVNGIKSPWVGHAMFAPDGNSIVFDAPQQTSPGHIFDIHQISSTGVETSLVEHPANDSFLGWSPDGRRLVFTSDRNGRSSIWSVAITDAGPQGEPDELRPVAGPIEPLGITRDGSLYYRLQEESRNIYTAVLDIANARTVSAPQPLPMRFNGPYQYPSWSADGTRLVFDSARDVTNPELMIYSASDRVARSLPVGLTHVWRAQWYDHDRGLVALGLAKDGEEAHFLIDPTNGTFRKLIGYNEVQGRLEAAWSSDGVTMYCRYADWRRGIFRLNIQTRDRRILYVPPPGVDLGTENFALSPDERMLAFHARNDGARTASLMIVPTQGGNARALLTISLRETFPFGSFTWTPDSRTILAARNKGEVSEIWRVPADGSAPAKIDFPPIRLASLRLNRDGKTIAFTNVKNRAEIWAFERFLK